MELWVNDRQVDEVVSQLAQNVPSMTAAFQWAAETAGSYLIEIRAYNQAGLVSSVAVTDLTAFGSQPTPTPAPTDIPLPAPTVTSMPSVTYAYACAYGDRHVYPGPANAHAASGAIGRQCACV